MEHNINEGKMLLFGKTISIQELFENIYKITNKVETEEEIKKMQVVYSYWLKEQDPNELIYNIRNSFTI